MSQKRIAIFGSTGSIGKQTLEVIAANPDFHWETNPRGDRGEPRLICR